VHTTTFTFSNAQGERCVITYDEAEHTVSFDRRKSGLTDFCQDFPTSPYTTLTLSANGKGCVHSLTVYPLTD
jgi:hypothetical protein